MIIKTLSQITLTGIRHMPSLSEETECFTANICIDGKKVGDVSNRGHGGCHSYSSRDLEVALAEFAKTLPPIKVYDMPNPHDPSQPFEYDPDGDSVISGILADWLTERDLRKSLSRRILFVRSDGRIGETARSFNAPELARLLSDPEKIKATFKASEILNLLPFARAVELYRAAA